ncbi:HutD family protein [Burkholderia cepacia]|uniref:HutD family protein n=1 Tax=Burkholderia cepacia GG4 TaxID=1009846 RepID=A0A9W3K4U1_BURCE|nr:HutD family protein [Burkholderia cepacia]AFQ51089.1 hypothetical protein GEM_4699 [Burkholderia cepacia GG4]
MALIDVYPVESIPTEAWRNGGGTTRTIATGGTQWRVSLASIERNGPYSRFPGIARVSLILGGDGVTLTSSETVVQLRPWVPEAYDGDLDWDAALVDRPSIALNVMATKGRYLVDVRIVDEPVVVGPGRAAIAVALGPGCTYAEGGDAPAGDLLPGHVLVSERQDRPLLLAPRGATCGKPERCACAALATIESAPAQELS